MEVEEFWTPFEVKLDSFDGLVNAINSVMAKAVERNIQFAWRGQVSANWALHSSLYRRLVLSKGKILPEDDLAKEEINILIDLHRWGLHSSAATGRLSVLRQLAMLQHYGAPTRLIDISFNAWVGVWFAVEEKWSNGQRVNEDQDARLFAFDVTNRLINENTKYRKWEDDLSRPWKDKRQDPIPKKEWTTSVFAWKPSNLDARIAAQNGGFLFGGVPATIRPDNKIFQFPKSPNFNDGWWKIDEGRKACCLAMRPHVFESKRGLGANSGALYTFRIASAAKKDIRQRLDKMFGYKHATIYPDYTGFASFGTPALKSY
jgi:hypothetical protein